MAKVEILKPVDQATGKRRLIDELRSSLSDPEFNDLKIVVAYAKSGPLLRLRSALKGWKDAGGAIRAVFGIDQQGTSKEALELALELFDEVYVTREKGITFHPKAYLFAGAHRARLYIGSNNLTVGGTETNFETAVVIDAELPGDASVASEATEFWSQLLPGQCPATRVLDTHLLNELVVDGHVLNEASLAKSAKKATKGTKPAAKSTLKLKPPSPLPTAAMTPKAPADGGAALPASTAGAAHGLAIQIKPHNNGEIFLSVRAITQNPKFFGMPFTGWTVPKKPGGAPYPQRVPDPVVNIQVYGAGGACIFARNEYDLNTVLYTRKGEIRVTASILVGVVAPYSILVMTPSEIDGVDYDFTIHRPDSPEYPAWLAMCNQSMPGGGQAPRKFGWF